MKTLARKHPSKIVIGHAVGFAATRNEPVLCGWSALESLRSPASIYVDNPQAEKSLAGRGVRVFPDGTTQDI